MVERYTTRSSQLSYDILSTHNDEDAWASDGDVSGVVRTYGCERDDMSDRALGC